MMPTSSGQMRKMIRLGTLEFTLKGQQMTLSAFTEGDVNRLFVPFSDMTSGTETYAAGRFLDLDRTGTNLYELDFNRAYIPVLLLQRFVRMPVPAAREPSEGSDPRRRKNENVIRAVVFDFDGVLANSEPLHFRAFRDVLAAEGLTLTEEAYYSRYLGYDDVGAFRAIAADANRSIEEAALTVGRAQGRAARSARTRRFGALSGSA